MYFIYLFKTFFLKIQNRSQNVTVASQALNALEFCALRGNAEAKKEANHQVNNEREKTILKI